MDLQKTMMMHVYLLAVLTFLCAAAPVSNVVVTVSPSVSVDADHTATLPCWLNPQQNVEGKEVRWYRKGQYDNPIILYIDKKYSQDASYAGRASFGLKDAASTGMAEGDVSLRLVNVTIKDAGDYVCYVSSDLGYDRETVHLSVTKTGSPPFLSVVWAEDNVMNVSCRSEGWYPQPSLTWSNQGHDVAPKTLRHTTVSSGLVSVHSGIQVSTSSVVSCSVGLSDREKKEASVHLGIPPQSETQGSSVVGWVMFALLLIGVLVLLGTFWYKKKYLKSVKKSGNESESREAEETEKLLPQMSIPLGDNVRYVNIDLKKTNNTFLIIKDRKLREENREFPDGEDVTCLTAIRGTRGFSSGQHYWEVSLSTANLESKKSWWIGVTSVTGSLQEHKGPPTTSNGFWFLSSSPASENSLQFNTDPHVFLSIHSRPKKIGVYLNYVKEELSFYNVDAKHLIGSLTFKFTGEVFPLFNPGKGDRSPMEILHKTEQLECSDMGNNSTAQVTLS